jgi:ssDNA-binding Zn-finger/Zn-ribbon topoisomerase 1
VEAQQRTLSSLNAVESQTTADLHRAQSMGAIRKFFAGLNEESLRRTLSETRINIKSCQDSIQAGSKQTKEIEDRMTGEAKVAEGLKAVLGKYPGEEQCKIELEQQNKRLDQIAVELKDIEAQLQSMRQELLGKCRVLATTVYQSYLKPEVARPFDVVIVDEASMLALPMVYYSSGLAKEKVIVAGDFRQLPPIVISIDELCKTWLKRDVFFSAGIAESVSRKEYPPSLVALDEQFRMQEDVCGVVNSFFYENRLKTAAIVQMQKPKVRPFPETAKGLLYVDTSAWQPWAALRLGTYSRYNVLHALLIRNIAAKLNHLGVLGKAGEINDRLGIIAPYSAQCRLLAELVGEGLDVRGSLYAATVHRFQGNERDIIIYDLTESFGARVGRFSTAQSLDEDGARLLNVALSRARHSMLLIGNFKYLRSKLPGKAYLRGVLDRFERLGHRLDVSDCFPFKPEEIMAGHQRATGATTYQIDGEGLTVFTAGTFYPAFEGDCRNAEKEIIIFSPFMTERGTGRWVELWRAKITEGVRVRLVVRPPGDQGGVLEHGLPELIESLRRIGVVVDERARMHEKLAFIDGKTLWHGSLNILSHRDTSESMLRVESPGACGQVGSFVVGRKWGGKEKVELTRAENPECPNCTKPMVWNDGRYGIWFECVCGQKADEFGRPRKSRTNHPPGPAIQVPHPTAQLGICPECGKPLKEKQGRYGKFVSCSGYPKCKYKPGKGRPPETPPPPSPGPAAPPSAKPSQPPKPQPPIKPVPPQKVPPPPNASQGVTAAAMEITVSHRFFVFTSSKRCWIQPSNSSQSTGGNWERSGRKWAASLI